MVYTLFTQFAAECSTKGLDFLSLKPWYAYINDKYDAATETGHFIGCDIKQFTLLPPHSDVPLVLLAVVDDLLRIAGLVAVGFVIVGAIKYITSQGQPEDTANAQSTIINALLGLVVSIVAVAFVSFLGSKLGG
ncbi:hypothetical protein COY17_04145 [Candidatus Saccharibacteria bacterium CG_4_10_14_0_2_um_filter_52_9]|nr:MAG: hypothetical protein COY17_04145 [Candidatus Saccharibacteria bacterium CG_4_10_14_0_2_um_filter_52_9]